jgi:hypothetical protein
MKISVTMMNVSGVLRWVTVARSTRPMVLPRIHVQARTTHRSSGALYSWSTKATMNQPTRNGQSTVRYQSIPEEMS